MLQSDFYGIAVPLEFHWACHKHHHELSRKNSDPCSTHESEAMWLHAPPFEFDLGLCSQTISYSKLKHNAAMQ